MRRQADVAAHRAARRRCRRACAPPAAGRCRPRWRRARCRAEAAGPRRRMSPASGRSTPAMRRRSSVRPAPTSPEMPSTSPRCSVEAGVAHVRRRASGLRAVEHDSSVRCEAWCSAAASSRPTIRATTALSPTFGAVDDVDDLAPSRRIVARRQTPEHLVHLVRDVDDRDAVARQLLRSGRRGARTPPGVRLEVGSSMARTLASSIIARAISTIWRWATLSVLDRRGRVDGRVERRKGLARAAAPARAATDQQPAGGRHRPAEEHVLRDGQLGNVLQLLVDHRDAGLPGGHRAVRRRPACRRPRSCPSLGWSTPERMLQQRRLAGAVLAEQRRALRRARPSANAVQSAHDTKALGDAREMQARTDRAIGSSSRFHEGAPGGPARRARSLGSTPAPSWRRLQQDLAQRIALDRVGLDVVLGDQRLRRRRRRAGSSCPPRSRSATSIATSPVSTGKESTVPVSSPARIEA